MWIHNKMSSMDTGVVYMNQCKLNNVNIEHLIIAVVLLYFY